MNTNTNYGNCNPDPTGQIKSLRLGFYKLTIKEGSTYKKHVYLDFRDIYLPSRQYCYSQSCSGNDITIRYSLSNNQVLFYNTANPGEFSNDYIILSTADIVTWGEVKCTNRNGFFDFFPNGLVVVPDINGRPKLIWGPHSNSLNLSYSVERRIESGVWVQIATTSNTYYTDNDYSIASQPGQVITYRVAAYINLELSQYTNNFQVAVYLTDKVNGYNNIISEFELYQNYPNPFNPNTNISYSIPENGLVKIEVFDILGNLKSTLINQIQLAGDYTIAFQAKNLSSGTYFYKLNYNGFSKTKKFTLIK